MLLYYCSTVLYNVMWAGEQQQVQESTIVQQYQHLYFLYYMTCFAFFCEDKHLKRLKESHLSSSRHTQYRYPQLSAPGVHTCIVHSCCRHTAGRLTEPGSLNSHYQQPLCELENHSECRKVADACSKSLVLVAAEFATPCKSSPYFLLFILH